MISFENDYFNNTVWRFKTGSRRQAPQGSRERYLGNVFDDLSGWTFRHAKPAESPAAANEAHLPDEEAKFLYETNAYTRNVLHDVNGETFGVFEQSGMPQAGLAEFAAALASKHAMKADVGTLADASPLRDPQRGDFRPAPGSAAIDHGVRNFVPWGLYAVVGEWHFRRNAKDPAVVLDEHWYMQPWFVDRSMYRQTPRYPLTVVGSDGDAFEQGPLEDWIDGALAFDGKTHAKVPHETIAADFTYEMTRRGAKTATRTTVPGSQKKTLDMDTNNFLIEAYVKVPAGHGGTLSAKTAGRTGYELAIVPPGANSIHTPGKVLLSLAADGRHAVLTTRDSIADGQWHHVLAEVDRTGKQMRLYVDGKVDSFTSIRDLRDASLANEGDFLVGKGPAGLLTGTVEFLRVARGTLADARTTIGELYAWQFTGPFLRDFAGNAPRGERRDAGALEATD
jgi:hypothetical protein